MLAGRVLSLLFWAKLIFLMKEYDWNKVSDNKKKEINNKNFIFILGSRELSKKRILQLADSIIAKGVVLWGVLKNPYIDGFEGQPHFKSLNKNTLKKHLSTLKNIKNVDDLKTVKNSQITNENLNKFAILEYYQRDIDYITDQLNFKAAIFINASWSRNIHTRKEYWNILNKPSKQLKTVGKDVKNKTGLGNKQRTVIKFLSPFCDEQEAQDYEKRMLQRLHSRDLYSKTRQYSDDEIMHEILPKVSMLSFDHNFQTGAVLAQNGRILEISWSRIMPYETYAMHYGSLKEKNFSPPNDLNNYDTIHAEMHLIQRTIDKKITLKGKDLFINLLPCPTCTKTLALTGLKRILYQVDHSSGYAIKLLEQYGIEVVRRV